MWERDFMRRIKDAWGWGWGWGLTYGASDERVDEVVVRTEDYVGLRHETLGGEVGTSPIIPAELHQVFDVPGGLEVKIVQLAVRPYLVLIVVVATLALLAYAFRASFYASFYSSKLKDSSYIG
jgi:hypothetical protein